MKKRLYDLAYQFRKTKIWTKMYEDEIFAVELDGGEVGYCFVMGNGGEHIALAVYPGTRGLSSLRRIKDEFGTTPDAPFMQDCVQCVLEEKDMLSPKEIDEVRTYCKTYGVPFRAPHPTFLRCFPCCFMTVPKEQKDWKTIETALQVVLKIAEAVLKKGARGKEELGLIPVDINLDGETYIPYVGQNARPKGKTTIPLFTIVNDQLQSKRVPLPPFEDLFTTPPDRFDDDAVARLTQLEQKGVYECETRRFPDIMVGDPEDSDNPPYMPTFLFIVGRDRKRNPIAPISSESPMIDPNKMVGEFVNVLLREGVYPSTIKVRADETKTLLKELCRRANIRLETSNRLAMLDKVCEAMSENFAASGSVVELVIEMARNLSVDEIRQLPSDILEEVKLVAETPEFADRLPEDVVTKLMLAGL